MLSLTNIDRDHEITKSFSILVNDPFISGAISTLTVNLRKMRSIDFIDFLEQYEGIKNMNTEEILKDITNKDSKEAIGAILELFSKDEMVKFTNYQVASMLKTCTIGIMLERADGKKEEVELIDSIEKWLIYMNILPSNQIEFSSFKNAIINFEFPSEMSIPSIKN